MLTEEYKKSIADKSADDFDKYLKSDKYKNLSEDDKNDVLDYVSNNISFGPEEDELFKKAANGTLNEELKEAQIK